MDEDPDTPNIYAIIPVTSKLPGTELSLRPNELLWVEPDYVVGYRGRRNGHRHWRRWGRLLYQLIIYSAIGALFLALPDFALDALHTWKNPIVVFVLICCLGKILVDTLFYDHYQP